MMNWRRGCVGRRAGRAQSADRGRPIAGTNGAQAVPRSCFARRVEYDAQSMDSPERWRFAPTMHFAVVVGFILVLCAGSCESADGATIRVPSDVASIQEAIDVASDGDRIEIAPGTYAEVLVVSEKGLTIVGTGGARETVVRPEQLGSVIWIYNTEARSTVIEGLTLANGDAAFGGGVLAEGSGDVAIRKCVFDGNHASTGFGGAAIACWGGTAMTIESCVFTNNDERGDRQFYSGVITLLGASAVIRNNVLRGNATRAINLYFAGEPTIVENNTMVGNQVGVFVTSGQVHGGIAIRNNIVADNEVGIGTAEQFSYALAVFEYNLVFGNGTNYQRSAFDPTGTNGNLVAPPLFVDGESGDFRLEGGSPARDAGSSVDAPPDDHDGAPRPVDADGDGVASIDIGAFEAQTAVAFDVVIRDDRTGDVLSFSTSSGAWSFVRCGELGIGLAGTGTVTGVGTCKVRFATSGVARVKATFKVCRARATARVRSDSLAFTVKLADSNTGDSTPGCPP